LKGSVAREDGAARLLAALRSAGLTAAFAESCTGGLCAAAITAIPGSSACFLGGVVSYSNGSKRDLLGVREETLGSHGAVSAEVVREMAEGAALRFGSDCALAVSGVAGPDGGTAEKPVGTVWIAARFRYATIERRCRFDGDREAVRRASREAALDLLADLVSGRPRGGADASDQA
jgi:nicotinamide-nucleotide amidase